jgi:hypothetical protein
VALGACIAFAIGLHYDNFLERAANRDAPWTKIEEYRRLPMACLGGPFIVVALFWLGWTSSPNIHWALPMIAGLFFGVGFVLIFTSVLNYMADAYRQYAASASAAASFCRSIFGAVLPLAAPAMYSRLGIGWGNSLLGFVSLGLTIIPFVLIKYGESIRRSSRFSMRVLEEAQAAEAQGGKDENGPEPEAHSRG